MSSISNRNTSTKTTVFYNENDIVLNTGDYMNEFLVVNEPNSVRMTRTLPNGNTDVIGTLPVNACIGLFFHTCWSTLGNDFEVHTSRFTFRVTKNTSFTKYNSLDDILDLYDINKKQKNVVGKFYANLIFQVVPGLCMILPQNMMNIPKEIISTDEETKEIISTTDTEDALKNFYVVLTGTCGIYLDNKLEVGIKYDLELLGESSFRSDKSRRTANVKVNKNSTVLKFIKTDFLGIPEYQKVESELRFRVTENERLNNEHYLDLDYNLLKRQTKFGSRSRSRQFIV